MSRRARVFLLERNSLVRQCCLRPTILKGGFELIGEAERPAEAIKLVGSLKPDVLISNIETQGMNCFKAIGGMRKLSPETKFILCTGHDPDECFLRPAVEARISGWVTKPFTVWQLIVAVHIVAKGGMYFDHAASSALVPDGDYVQLRARVKEDPLLLGWQEVFVLRAFGRGMMPSEVASVLHVPRSIVARLERSLKRKLGMPTREALARYARLEWMVHL